MSNPTDTNQASELFELCKKVYELTSWKDTRSRLDDGNHTIRNEGNEVLLGSKQAPLYTSDYLLEKLPKHVDHLSLKQNNKLTINSSDGEKGKWYAHYWLRSRRLQVSSDTPLKALLKLSIALSEAGELK